MFGILYNILRPKYSSALKDVMLNHNNLVDYTNFMAEKYFSDKQNKWCQLPERTKIHLFFFSTSLFSLR